MSTITFRGAHVRFADLRQREEAGIFARIHFTSDLSTPVIEAMDWQPIPDCVEATKLTGNLTARNLVLTPNQKELRQHEIQMECSEVSDFQLFRIQGEDGDSKRTELRFLARIIEPGAIARVENYMRLVGTSKKSDGALKITYDDQQKLDLAEKDGEPTCVDCENKVPMMHGSTTVHASGQKCLKAEESKAEPALASAREAAGGTHQKKK